MKPKFEDLLLLLKKNDLKMTDTRKGVLKTLFDHHGPFTAEEIHHRYLKSESDLATVYRTLTSLEEVKMVKRCEFGDGVSRYELVHQEDHHHHHHLICTYCKKIEVLTGCEIEDEVSRLVKKHGYQQVSHQLEFFGICPECSE